MKNLITIALVFIIILLLGALGFIGKSYVDMSKNSSKSTSSASLTETAVTSYESSSEKSYAPADKLLVSGYIADFAYQNGLTTAKQYIQAFDSLSPVWYSISPKKADGLDTKVTTADKNLIALCKQNNVKLIPSIAQFEYADLSTVLNDPKKLLAHIDRIVKETVDNNYAGIDIDYENVIVEDKEPYLSFIKSLSEKLHAKNKLLIVTVLAKDNLTKEATQTRTSQDWARLSVDVDQIRIMVYEYKNLFKASYAVTPLFFLERVMSYARSVIPIEKISIGLPLYANRYKSDVDKIALTYKNIVSIKATNKILEDKLDPETNEKLLKFSEYEVWYTDKEVDTIRRNKIKSVGISNIFYWRLGDEDTSIFQ